MRCDTQTPAAVNTNWPPTIQRDNCHSTMITMIMIRVAQQTTPNRANIRQMCVCVLRRRSSALPLLCRLKYKSIGQRWLLSHECRVPARKCVSDKLYAYVVVVVVIRVHHQQQRTRNTHNIHKHSAHILKRPCAVWIVYWFEWNPSQSSVSQLHRVYDAYVPVSLFLDSQRRHKCTSNGLAFACVCWVCTCHPPSYTLMRLCVDCLG